MRWALLAGLMLAACGCELADDSVPTLKKEIVQLETERDALRASNDWMADALDESERAGNDCRKQADALIVEVEQLKQQIDRLVSENRTSEAQARKRIRELEVALAKTVPTPPAEQAPPATATSARPAASASAAQIEKAIAETESRLMAVRAKIAEVNKQVTATIRSTLDVRVPPPRNGVVVPPDGQWHDASKAQYYQGGPDGLILVRVQDGYTSRYSAGFYGRKPRYKYVPAGPAIKRGDFRTQADRDEAIADAKKPLAGLCIERTGLEAELKRLRGALRSPRASSQEP